MPFEFLSRKTSDNLHLISCFFSLRCNFKTHEYFLFCFTERRCQTSQLSKTLKVSFKTILHIFFRLNWSNCICLLLPPSIRLGTPSVGPDQRSQVSWSLELICDSTSHDVTTVSHCTQNLLVFLFFVRLTAFSLFF